MIKNQFPKVYKSKTPKVYKNRKLNTANFGNFTHNDYQVFLHLVSKIGGVDEVGKYLQPEQLQREHTLAAKEFREIFNTDASNSYKVLSKAVDKLMKTDIKLEKADGKGVTRINVCSKAEYNKNEGYISIKFTDDIMPYLAQAKQKFMLYNLKEIARFGSLHTTRLYELIQEFTDTGYMIKSVAQLREAFAVGNSFKLYSDFKKRTFAHACEEINSNYAMGLRFEEIKEGRKVVAVKFFFKKTKVHKAINQHTGVSRNIYEKPELLDKEKKNKAKKQDSDLDSQLSFENLKESPKSMKGVMSSFLTKFFPPKK
jgi:plasmid replication initiation protein